MFKTIANAFRDKEIRKRIFLTLGILLIFRIGCHVPIPGLNIAGLQAAAGNSGEFMMVMNTISGGALSQGMLFALGILPFINSFIIMQLLTLIIPKLEKLSKSGDDGRKKITQITRYVAIVLALVQGFGIMMSWGDNVNPLFGSIWLTRVLVVVILTAGSTFVMWLGERITEYGIGNGTSLIIFVGIVSQAGVQIVTTITNIVKAPDAIAQAGMIWQLIGFIIIVCLLFAFIVFVDLSERRIGVQYAKQVKGNKMYGGQKTHIPLKVNGSGVMPIIFASAFLMFPQMIASFWPASSFYTWYSKYMGVGSWAYIIVMTIFILFFAYFYAQIQFNPIDVSKNIQQYGGFIPGIRPGKPTSDYLAKINNRITLFGALFLAFIALVPSLIFKYLGADIGLTNAFSATGLLIIVSVALEFDKQLNSQIMMKHYKGFLK